MFRPLRAIPARHILCFMLFFGFMVTFLLRVNINLAIVAMVNSTNMEKNEPASTDGNECMVFPHEDDVNSTEANPPIKEDIGEFEWNEFQQGIVLSSFFWGYVLFQIPGGRVAEVLGPKMVFGTSVLINSLLSLSLPFVSRLHWTLLLVVRALQGLGQGVIFPCLNAAVPRWVPVEERSRFISFAVQGCSLGQVIALPLCGWILTTMGWPAVFYISGILGLMWYLAWYFLVYDSPDEHPRISLKEKQYLQKKIEKFQRIETPPVPWFRIMTSLPFWVGAIASIGSDWGFHTFCTFGPKYIKSALGFDLEQSSWLSSLPFLSQYVCTLAFSSFCDWLLKMGVRIIVVRKFSVVICIANDLNSAAHLMPALGLVVLTFTGCHVTYSVIILTFCVTTLGAMSCGFFQNPLDIAPNFAGSITGITNTLGATTAVISTPLAGAILQSTGTKKGWHYIFYVAASLYIVSGLPYLLLAKVKVEPWNELRSDMPEEKKLKLNEVSNAEIKTEELTVLTHHNSI